MRLLLALHCFDPGLDRWRVLAATPNRAAVEAFCHASSQELLSELEKARACDSSIVPVLEADLRRLNTVLHLAEANRGNAPELRAE